MTEAGWVERVPQQNKQEKHKAEFCSVCKAKFHYFVVLVDRTIDDPLYRTWFAHPSTVLRLDWQTETERECFLEKQKQKQRMVFFLELPVEKGDCFPSDLLIFNIALAIFNGVLAAVAFSQVCFENPFLCYLYCLCFRALLKIWSYGFGLFCGIFIVEWWIKREKW